MAPAKWGGRMRRGKNKKNTVWGKSFLVKKNETNQLLFLRYWEMSDSLLIITEERSREDKEDMFRRT